MDTKIRWYVRQVVILAVYLGGLYATLSALHAGRPGDALLITLLAIQLSGAQNRIVKLENMLAFSMETMAGYANRQDAQNREEADDAN
jgi:hypothetical protein